VIGGAGKSDGTIFPVDIWVVSFQPVHAQDNRVVPEGNKLKFLKIEMI
jgi:hypothetical protein